MTSQEQPDHPAAPRDEALDPEADELVFEEIEAEFPPRTLPAAAPPFPGQVLAGRFEVVEVTDADGCTLRVRDRVRQGDELALEVLPTAAETQALERLLTALKSLRGSGIDPLLEGGRLPDGRPYFASRWLEGERLSDRLERGAALAPDDAFEVTERLLRALEAGHALDRPHGSLTPERLLFVPGEGRLGLRFRLLGFGRATLEHPTDADVDLRAVPGLLVAMLTGQTPGTPLFEWWQTHAPALRAADRRRVQQVFLLADAESAQALPDVIRTLADRPRDAARARRPSPLVPVALAVGALAVLVGWILGRGDDEDGAAGRAALAAERSGVEEPGDPPAAPALDPEDVERDEAASAPDDALAARPPLTIPAELPPAQDRAPTEQEQVLTQIDAQLAQLRSSIEATNGAVEDLGATTGALGARLEAIDLRIADLEARRRDVASQGAASALEQDAETIATPDVPESTPEPGATLPLPAEASPALRTAAEGLFSGDASPFGPVGTRSVHHTRAPDGEEGWLVQTVRVDDATPVDSERSWLLDEEYFSADGRAVGGRVVQVVQRGARFVEVDGREYALLDLESAWLELETALYRPSAAGEPPARLGVDRDAIERLRERGRGAVALVAWEGERESWFVPGLGFVRYEDPERIHRELIAIDLP